ncbi:hypothetical protein [Paucibacter sp. KCTC 42545]|nr:hypothetical protein [Paucibacter sp. KCTC 42545]
MNYFCKNETWLAAQIFSEKIQQNPATMPLAEVVSDGRVQISN